MASTPAIKNPRPTAGGGKSGTNNTAFTMQKRLSAIKVNEYSLVSNFGKFGYRNREDITILPPGVLVLGSYNVVSNVGERVGVVKGYTLDGQASSTITPITSSYDFTKVQTNDRHVRTWGTQMEFRYVNPVSNQVSWVPFFNSLISGNDVNYASFWDITSITTDLLFVNGTPQIYKWSGAVASFASATSTTLTKSGSTTWAEEGFNIPASYSATSLIFTPNVDGGGSIEDPDANFLIEGFSLGDVITVSGTTNNNTNFTIIDITADLITVGFNETVVSETSNATIDYIPSLVINGVSYTYTGGTDTVTITGVSPDPTGAAYTVGTPITQNVQAYDNASTNLIKPDFNNDLIANLDNQIFIGSTNSSTLYTSNVNNFLDYFYSKPRLQGEGYEATIAGYPTAFVNQEDSLYISAGKDLWYRTQLVNTTTSVSDGSGGSINTVYQTLIYQQLKTAALQSAQSQAATTKIKNDIVFLSFEPIVNTLGRVEDILLTPQVSDLSYSIVNDMNNYDLTDVALCYFRQFLYISIPREGLIRIYNMSNQAQGANGENLFYWEAPVTYPIGRFSIINDQLYGHGYAVPETYKLFDGYEFNGHDIPARAAFSYNNFGTRSYPKNFNLFYLEGYITSNCTLTYGFNYDIDGCQTQRVYDLEGNNKALVCLTQDDASLGKTSLGKRPLGGLIPNPYSTGLPPKFRAIKQLSELPFYELQIFFESLGNDQQWELVAFGPNARPAMEGNNARQY